MKNVTFNAIYNRVLFLLIGFVLCGSSLANAKEAAQGGAQGAAQAGYFCAGLSGGYSTLVGHSQDMRVLGGGTGGAILGYEHRIGNLLLRCSGDFYLFSSNCKTDIMVGDVQFRDTRQENAVMHYELLSPLKERQVFGLTNLGFMIGYSGSDIRKTDQSAGGFYILGGIKLGVRFDVNSIAELNYSTKATYSKYIDDYENAPKHFYKEWNERSAIKFGTKFNLMLSAELGWEFNLKKCDKMKLGLFVDYGVMNQIAGMETKECLPNPDNVSEIVLKTHYQSSDMKDRYVTPVMTGIKIVFSLNCIKEIGCSSCKCYM